MDLIRTGDADEQPDDASEDETGPVLSGTSGLMFADLVSDEETQKSGKWDFGQHEAEDSATTRSALQAKIREKLEESGRGKGLKKKRKQTTGTTKAQEPEPEEPEQVESAPVESQGTPEHLRTNIHFADLRLSKPLLRACSELKFECPTPVQRDVIPSALGGSDVLATAETGSGKTASFLLPMLERLCQSSSVRARRRDAAGRLILGPVGTKAVVLIPTRELAVQCHSMLQRLAKYTMVTHQLVAGGYIAHDQAASLRHQPDLVVATPGRLLDHLMNTQSVHMELLEIVVFDEADRLLEMGFRQECLEVLKRCAKGCQTMLFSATLNASVEDLAALALVKPQRIHASPVNAVAQTLEQEFVKAPSAELREAALLSLASRNYNSRVIIFCSTKEVTHRLAIIFGLSGLKFAEIHGNLSQVARAASLQQFQNGEANFLLATDIASRGLDLPDIKTVINFQLPVDVTRYIHRVGRTARMGRAGRAVTIYCPDEYTKVKQLGRQCCNKVKSKVLRRSIAAEAIQHWADRIAGFEQDIKSIIEEEQVDKELELADLLTQKSENMQKYKQDIQSRPAKEWFMSNKDKQKQQWEDQKKRKMQETNDLEDDTSSKKKKEKRKGPLTEEELEERRKERTRQRVLAKREAEKKQRLEEQAKARASARRGRKANQKQKGDRAAPTIGEQKFKEKVERRKKKGKGEENERRANSNKDTATRTASRPNNVARCKNTTLRP
ncbi:unnamed protein product [Cladocopium goreaui]|uniref:Uncharacterized protein n=1 Tax=Cladocopium goreaui TaxID=2562237 RepID=A0A9P1BPE0_9DINO|nr:unnamed protein product [Cladocopium goreaui]